MFHVEILIPKLQDMPTRVCQKFGESVQSRVVTKQNVLKLILKLDLNMIGSGKSHPQIILHFDALFFKNCQKITMRCSSLTNYVIKNPVELVKKPGLIKKPKLIKSPFGDEQAPDLGRYY